MVLFEIASSSRWYPEHYVRKFLIKTALIFRIIEDKEKIRIFLAALFL